MDSFTSAQITGIDTHAHVFRADLPLAQHCRYVPEYNALDNEFVGLFEQHGLSHGVLIQPSFLGTDNHFLVDALKAHPNKLKGIAMVDPSISDAELLALNDVGVVGIRLNLIGKPLDDYRAPVWQHLFSRLATLGWQVEVQREIDDLYLFLPAILESGVEVVVDHFSRPIGGIQTEKPSHKAFLSLLANSPIWIKLSAMYRANATLEQAKEMMTILRDAYGHSERFLWGSDWPHTQFESQTQYSEQFAIMKALISNPIERQKILIDNPAKCFTFPLVDSRNAK